MNNVAYWSAVEEELSRRFATCALPMRAEVEFRVAIQPGADVQIHTCDSDDGCEMWMVVGSTVHASER